MTGKELKELRQKKNMSQWAIAKALGISQGLVSIWEQEYREIPNAIEEEIKKICE